MRPDLEMAVESANYRHTRSGGPAHLRVIVDRSSFGVGSKLKTCHVSTHMWKAGIWRKLI